MFYFNFFLKLIFREAFKMSCFTHHQMSYLVVFFLLNIFYPFYSISYLLGLKKKSLPFIIFLAPWTPNVITQQILLEYPQYA